MRKLLGTAAACVAFAACSVAGVERSSPAKIAGPSPRAYAYVVVSVGDMQQALDLWEERFGMELSRREQGADVGLARIWGLADDAIADQALLNTPGMVDGGIHLVRFTRPADAVRDGAAPADLGPLTLEIAVQDRAAEPSELRMHAHDGVELVFRERQGKLAPLSSKGYGVALQMATVVPDIERELAFFQHVLGLEALSTGVPPGGEPDVRIVGARDSRFGRLALVHYAATPGRDLYPRAAPPARGMLSVTYVVPDLAPILARGRGAGIADHGPVRSILGEGRMASVTSPAGLRIDLVQL